MVVNLPEKENEVVAESQPQIGNRNGKVVEKQVPYVQRKKAVKKRAVAKAKSEAVVKEARTEPGSVSEYEEFFKELREVSRCQYERGGVCEVAG